MKKVLAFLLGAIITLALFGGVSVGADGVFPEYTPVPGFTAFSAEGLSEQNNITASFVGFTDNGLATFRRNKEAANYWQGVSLYTFQKLSFLNSQFEPTWSIKDNIDGTDIFGDTGLSFAGADGVAFYIEVNGEPYDKGVELICCQTPAKGPYYQASGDIIPSTEGDPVVEGWEDKPYGFAYRGLVTARDGYCYFDFAKDFVQYDWWSEDDDGVNRYEGQQRSPIPASKIALINGFEIAVNPGITVDVDTVSVGNFMIVKGGLAPVGSMDFFADGFELGNMPEDVVVTNECDVLETVKSYVFREDLAYAPFAAGEKYILSVEVRVARDYTFAGIDKDNITITLSTGEVLTAGSVVLKNDGYAKVFFELPALIIAGDVDGDGVVTVSDALYILRAAAKLAPPRLSDGAPLDFDGDGEVTVSDALAVLRIAAGLA